MTVMSATKRRKTEGVSEVGGGGKGKEESGDEDYADEEMLLLSEHQPSTGQSAKTGEEYLFDIQVEELLREVRKGEGEGREEDKKRYRQSVLKHVQALLEKIQAAWDDEEERETISAADLSGKGESFLSALGLEGEGQNVTIAPEPPEAMEIVGSFSFDTCEASISDVDIAVKMRESTFTPKDFLSYRYFGKRALYLTYLVKSLFQIKELGKEIQYEWFNNDALRPIAVCTTHTPGGRPIRVRFIPCLSHSVFEIHKLHPYRNNIKKGIVSPLARPSTWREGQRSYTTRNENQELVTPHYTNSIAEDCMLLLNQSFLLESVSANSPLTKAVVLLKIWARQHNLLLKECGMTGHFYTMLAAWVWQTKGISPHASTIQIFKLLIEGIGAIDFVSGESMRNNDNSALNNNVKDSPALNIFRNTFETVFLDCTGWMNLASRAPASAIAILQECAKCTMEVCDSFLSPETKFEKLFLMKPYFGMHFDHHFQISIKKKKSSGSAVDVFGGDLPRWTDEERLVEYIAKLALGKRVTTAHCQARKLLPQTVKRSSKGLPKLGVMEPKLNQGEKINLLLRSNSEVAGSLVDVGPKNTEKESCRCFRAFWGDMSQLRQFKDTSIAEAVIWDTTVKAPHVIIQKALAYALGRNMKPMFSIELSTRETALDFLVDNKNVSQEKANAIKAFDKLARILRSMDSLPLKIESLQAASSLYRCTDPLPLKKHKLCGPGRARANHSYKLFVPVIQCYAGLEASGRWPKDVESQKKTISAMALHVAISLEKGFGIRCVGTEDYIDIMYDGYAFRVALHASSGPSTLTADSISKSIRHHTAISGLATKYSSYCSVVQLARRWFGSHLMSLHVTQEVVELLVAEAFCNPSCLPTPASHWSGFLRFLQNVATFPWGERAMYVALMAGEMTASDHRAKIRQVESNYQRLREKSKFYLSTPYQADLQFWTDGHTASKACRHAVSAAKASMTFLNSEMPAGYTSFNQKILSLFTPNLKRHHVILRLHPESISLMKYFVCISEVNTKERKNQIADLVHLQSVTAAADNTDVKSKLIFGQNMVLEALRNVQKMLGKQAYVGYDEFGGTTAVISWNPSFFDPSLELQGGGGEEFTLPVDMSGRDPNILAVMTEVCTHLRGFVSDVNYS